MAQVAVGAKREQVAVLEEDCVVAPHRGAAQEVEIKLEPVMLPVEVEMNSLKVGSFFFHRICRDARSGIMRLIHAPEFLSLLRLGLGSSLVQYHREDG